MKIILVAFIFLFQLTTAFSQNKIFILPKESKSYLYKEVNNDLIKLDNLEFSITKLYSIDKNQFVIVNSDSTNFQYGFLNNDGEIISNTEFIPSGFKIKSVNIFGDFIYLGGSWNADNYFTFIV